MCVAGRVASAACPKAPLGGAAVGANCVRPPVVFSAYCAFVRRAGDRRSPLHFAQPSSLVFHVAFHLISHLTVTASSTCPHNSALSFSQLKLSELCASLELQAAVSATGGAAFCSSRGSHLRRHTPCLPLEGKVAVRPDEVESDIICVAAQPTEMGQRPCAVTPARRSPRNALPAWVSRGSKTLRGVSKGATPLWWRESRGR